MKHGGRGAGGVCTASPTTESDSVRSITKIGTTLDLIYRTFPKGVGELLAIWAFIYRSKIQYGNPPPFQNMAKIEHGLSSDEISC
jgi:hypothetical protein